MAIDQLTDSSIRDFLHFSFDMEETDFSTYYQKANTFLNSDNDILTTSEQRFINTLDRDFKKSNYNDNVELEDPVIFVNRGKAADTRLGGNDAINSYYQYNKDDDIIYNVNKTPEDSGMGRVYSKAIDDNQQILYLSFGLPQHNHNIIGFFARSVLYDAVNLMAEGSNSGRLARMAGTLVGIGVIALVPVLGFLVVTTHAAVIYRNIRRSN